MIISSNFGVGEYLNINLKIDGEPRKIISNLLKENYFNTNVLLLGFIVVGRRFIYTENLNLLNGRRHRIYWGLIFKKKITIRFGWNKIKRLSDIEFKFLKENWSFNFFEKQGKHFIEKSGGVLSFNHLIYTKTGIII